MSDQIPVLPDDILRMVIEELSTAHRALLGLVSTRFRSLDLAVGKRKFDKINIFLESNGYNIVAIVPTGYYYITERITNDECEDTALEDRQLLKRAHVEALELIVESPQDESVALALSSIIHSLRCKEINVMFDAGVSPESVFGFLTSLDRCGIVLDYAQYCWNYDKHPNACSMLKNLQQHPTNIKELFLWYADQHGQDPIGEELHPNTDASQERFFIDGLTMLHLIRASNEVTLPSTKCTLHEFLEAIEIVCESKLDSKHIVIFIAQTVIVEFINLAKQDAGLIVFENHTTGQSIVRDLTRGCELIFNTNLKCPFIVNYFAVAIYKIDQNGKALTKHIKYDE